MKKNTIYLLAALAVGYYLYEQSKKAPPVNINPSPPNNPDGFTVGL